MKKIWIYDLYNTVWKKTEICGTITTRPEEKKTAVLPVVEDKRKMEKEKTEKKTKYRIRKLTPLETWRLQNFSDEDFRKAEAVNSNSQLYKESGNSICVAVLCAIFSQLGIQGHKKWNEMTLEERRQLVYKGTVLEAK